MVSPEYASWMGKLGSFMEDIPDGAFSISSWHSTLSQSPIPILPSNNPCAEVDVSMGDSDAQKGVGGKKRSRAETSVSSSSKACKEKLRRDKLNDKFAELAAILDPGRPLSTDKAAILIDAVKTVTQMRNEVQKLKDTNLSLQEKIKDLKAEKNELREEKQKLRSDKEKLEQQMKGLSAPPSFIPPPAMPAAFPVQGQTSGNKLVPFVSYPSVAMWQFMPPTAVDTSHDHALRPPVA